VRINNVAGPSNPHRPWSSKDWSYQPQCLECGATGRKMSTCPVTLDETVTPEEAAAYRMTKEQDYRDRLKQEYQERIQELAAADERESAEWWKRYTEYLKSPRWKARAAKVLRRDNYLCQACLERTATQVHHLTYKHVFNEPAFDLTSVCETCHKAIHKIQDERANNGGCRRSSQYGETTTTFVAAGDRQPKL
jgi:5-methylcytosine-specific restriction endonuclease McrA